jgi:hypothetical protein
MNINYKTTTLILSVLVITLMSVVAVLAATGTTDSPAAPSSTKSYTLEDIYDRLDSGAAGTQSIFTEPSVAPGIGTMHDLNDIMGKAPALDNTNGATSTHVLVGQTFWGLTASQWATQTGTMPNNGAVTLVPTTTNIAIAAGYHNGSGYVISDTDLISVNIKSGVNLFEVEGELHGGCTCANGTLNGTRWCDNGDGTVTDLLGDSTNNNAGQCLVWLKNANCSANLANINKTGTLVWDDATIWSSAVINGICGLSDGSSGYEWRLPTQAELKGITNGTEAVFSRRMRAFTGIQSSLYWSSTTHRHYTTNAWYVVMLDSDVGYTTKGDDYYVWPVRDGQ